MTALPRETIERAMAEALGLAERGRFRVEPNPPVGAVVFDRDGAAAGRGFHARWGGPHAEAAAIAQAGERARGGTLVVTLEPCAHEGKKTPACVPAIVAAGVARVIAGTADPNQSTAGRASSLLAAAGIAYECGVAEDRCRALIERYVASLGARRPWTVAKWAASLDGRTADGAGASRWISSEASRDLVHELRRAADAVVVGRTTVERDDPSLTARPAGPRRCVRVVFDTDLRTPASAKVVASAREHPTRIVCARDADASRRRVLERAGVEVCGIARGDDGRVRLPEAFAELRALGLQRLLLESGGTMTAACLRAGLVDQVAAFVAPVVIGGVGPTPFAGEGWPIAGAPRLEEVRITPVGSDALVEGYWPSRPAV